jgi:hypothetical protein
MEATGSAQRLSMDNTGGGNMATDIDLHSDPDWFLRPNGVPTAIEQRRNDIMYELEENTSSKRGGRTITSRDVYIVYPDYSQTTLNVHYDGSDPYGTVQFEQSHKPPPQWRQDQLEEAHYNYGRQVLDAAYKAQNLQIPDGQFVAHVLKQVHGALPSVGRRAHGAVIYKNLANSSVNQLDEIRPGDIVMFRSAKFQGHKGGLHQKYSFDVGTEDVHLAVVSEWDGTKKKIRVIEQPEAGSKKHDSYKLTDLKSGEVRVFRVVGRDYVGW